ncbi:hypothetical protein GCM10022197_07850 [Microlunatus spumicola]|uniref:Beta-lactamase-related domain-containing protein n=1 Tax=Microlunatus spumicola TaxID=81499 RepID=A0ABP6WT46_9ACTN
MTSELGTGTDLLDRVRRRTRDAGYGSAEPVVVGLERHGTAPIYVASGSTRTGSRLDGDTVIYTASLAKQVTAVLAALLVREGRLDLEAPLVRWLPELPVWAGEVRLRHLLSHTSGLPEGATFGELERSGRDRTTAVVVEALARCERPASAPGSGHRYSNAGYVCLGLVLERVTSRGLAALAEERLLGPLRMGASRFWSGPEPHPPRAAPLDDAFPAPLSLGDGGLWSSAADLLRWNRALADDALGVTDLVQTPGRLDDGTLLDYAWGVGVRAHAGAAVFRHGGRWAGLCAQLVRVPGHGSLVVLALDDDEDRASSLADALLEEVLR